MSIIEAPPHTPQGVGFVIWILHQQFLMWKTRNCLLVRNLNCTDVCGLDLLWMTSGVLMNKLRAKRPVADVGKW